MSAFRTALLFIVAGSVPASAADFPTRKAGLWEITTNVASHAIKMQQCIDATTDHAMQAHAGSAPQGDCSKREVQKSGATMTIDSVCTFAGKTVTSHVVANGSFDSEYTLTVTSQAEGRAGGDSGHDERQVAWSLRGGSETRRYDHAERHEAQHPVPAESAAQGLKHKS
jgi:hypothetical protein